MGVNEAPLVLEPAGSQEPAGLDVRSVMHGPCGRRIAFFTTGEDVFAYPARLKLSERIGYLAPLREPHFAASGADVIEIALKTGRLYSGRPGILAFTPAHHGTTLGALQDTSRSAFRAPFTEPLEHQC